MEVVFSKLYRFPDESEKRLILVLFFGCIFLSVYGINLAKMTIYRKI